TELTPVAPSAEPEPTILPLPPRRRRFILPAVAVAAAAVLIASGIWLGTFLARGPEEQQAIVKPAPKDQPQPPAPPLMAQLVECDVRLAQAETPKQRVEALAHLADALWRETHTLGDANGGAAKEVAELAGLYERVVRDGVVPRARTLPRPQR